jgi:hypothetical protein
MTNFAHPHESVEDAEVSESKVLEPKIAWAARERERTKWVPIAHGERVLPPNEQKSNLHLTDEQVMKKRNEPIASTAPPLNLGGGRALGDDDTFTKKTGGEF